MATKTKTTRLSSKQKSFYRNPAFIGIVAILVAAGLFFAISTFAAGAHDPYGTQYKDRYGCSRDYRYRPALGVGSVHGCVRTLQDDLQQVGIFVGPGGSDGQYGTNTYNAVRYFQALNHLTADGVVGPKTWITLYCNVETHGCS